MCVVSMVGDHYCDRFWPSEPEQPLVPWDPMEIVPGEPLPVGRNEFDELKKAVEEMKALLQRAKKYDEDNGEPDCETDEKLEILRRLAEQLGVDLEI